MSEIRVEIDLPHPPDRVWRALTDPGAVSSWFLPTDLEPQPGGVFRARPDHVPGFTGPFEIEVLGVTPGQALRMQWRGDQLHTSVSWEIEPAAGGCHLVVRQAGFLGVNGTLRRRELRRAYQEMFEERLPGELDRIARAEPAAPRQLIAAGRARVVTHDVDNELPSAAPPVAPGLDDPSDPWALHDPMVSAGVGLPLPDEEPPPPLADSHARRTLGRRLMAAFPLEERVRAAAITVTVALVVVTVGWLWLTRPNHEDAPPVNYPLGSNAPAGEQPGGVFPSGVAPSAGNDQPRASGGPVASGAPNSSSGAVGPSSGPVLEATASPPPGTADPQPLSASYATKSSTSLLGYKVVVTVRLHNPGTIEHSGWTVVLTVPSGAQLQGSDASVAATKNAEKVTITPNDSAKIVVPGTDTVFTVTFGGGALLGIGSGGVAGCTVDGAACTH